MYSVNDKLIIGKDTYEVFSLPSFSKEAGLRLDRLPKSVKILLENLLRNQVEFSVTDAQLKSTASPKHADAEIPFIPSRVLLQDFTGIPVLTDLASMRDTIADAGGDPSQINPIRPVDLVIDHSVIADFSGASDSFAKNIQMEYKRNDERYKFLKWGQAAFKNVRIIPPGTGIVHQVNVEYLAKVIWQEEIGGKKYAYPDSVYGTDSHTTMVNGVSVLGWGVGGIEAEGAMLGRPTLMTLPKVVGVHVKGRISEGVTATDVVLTLTQALRKLGVVGKFVEFFGDALDELSVWDRCTIANMAPEYGATCGFFPADAKLLEFLKVTGRDEEEIDLVERYSKLQGLWRTTGDEAPHFDSVVDLDLGSVVPSVAGPRRPQDRLDLGDVKTVMRKELASAGNLSTANELKDGDVVIAAITSCTNTSNPSVMLAAGIVARKAAALGLKTKPWVKTTLSPGSQVVADYLEAAGLDHPLRELGFFNAGFGCMTCIGNSGPLFAPVAKAVEERDLNVAAVLSGNRNFEGRVHPQVKSNFLASPPLVVAYALAGSVLHDFVTDPLGTDPAGNPVLLKDIWPSNEEIEEAFRAAVRPEMFSKRYKDVLAGDGLWQSIPRTEGLVYEWDANSTYVQRPPFANWVKEDPADLKNARALLILGDSITTDHISPAGSIETDSPAGRYLISHQVSPTYFNSYGTRRGNHEVMMRGTFANPRIANKVAGGARGPVSRYVPTGEIGSVYDVAAQYRGSEIPTIVVAGKEYGSGSSRDWAAKGPLLLGVRAVLAKSFERIHRSNLVGMAILPIEFPANVDAETLNLTGDELIDISFPDGASIVEKMFVDVSVSYPDGSKQTFSARTRIDTSEEVKYYEAGGMLPFITNRYLANQ